MPRQRRPSHQRTQGAIAALMIAAGAMIAVPQQPASSADAPPAEQDHLLEGRLQELGSAIGRYRIEHGSLPGQLAAPQVTAARWPELFVHQLTRATDPGGRVAPAPEPEFPFGPYLPVGLPANPTTGLTTVRFASFAAAADGSAGWIIDPANGQVRADTPARHAR
jgi:hypothetical protein